MWFNPIMRMLLRSPLHFFVSKNILLMTYQGRKSGRIYTTPMNYLSIDDALYTISSRERVWWRNLRGDTPVTLRLRGDDVRAHAEVIEDPSEVACHLSLYLQTAPQLARYMNARVGPEGVSEPEEIYGLAQEKIVVRTRLTGVPCNDFFVV